MKRLKRFKPILLVVEKTILVLLGTLMILAALLSGASSTPASGLELLVFIGVILVLIGPLSL